MAWAVSPLGVAVRQVAVASVSLLVLVQRAVAWVSFLVLAQLSESDVAWVLFLVLAQLSESDVAWLLVLALAQLSESDVALLLVLESDVALVLESDVARDPLYFRSFCLTCRKLFNPVKKSRRHRSCVHGISSCGRTRGSG